jgi:alcohol dehydrogenase/L-iditol 2-dehydrogenase
MKAIVSAKHGSGMVTLENASQPLDPLGDQVILKMKAIGVCGSDVHIYQGIESYDRKSPVILGHEMVGEVYKIGDKVKHYKVGDRVVSETAAYVCGECYNCRRGYYNLCTKRMGFGALVNGGMAEYLATRQDILHKVPDEVDDITAALTEPTSVAFNATSKLGKIEPGDDILIIGPGPIGLLCLETALLRSPYNISVLGIKSDVNRLEIAKEMGANNIYDDAKIATAELIHSGWGDGVDIVIDASGVSSTLKTALDVIRPGGTIVKVGWGPDIPNFNLDKIVSKAVNLKGSFSHYWDIWERVLRLFKIGKLKPAVDLKVKNYPIERWEDAFKDMENQKIAKAVIRL